MLSCCLWYWMHLPWSVNWFVSIINLYRTIFSRFERCTRNGGESSHQNRIESARKGAVIKGHGEPQYILYDEAAWIILVVSASHRILLSLFENQLHTAAYNTYFIYIFRIVAPICNPSHRLYHSWAMHFVDAIVASDTSAFYLQRSAFFNLLFFAFASAGCCSLQPQTTNWFSRAVPAVRSQLRYLKWNKTREPQLTLAIMETCIVRFSYCVVFFFSVFLLVLRFFVLLEVKNSHKNFVSNFDR